MDQEELLKLIEDDEFGLLMVKCKASTNISADERLIAAFEEINDFVRQSNRLPTANKDDMIELGLYYRLNGIKEDEFKIEVVKKNYEFNLLQNVKIIKTLDDVFADDDLGLFAEDENSIFKIQHIAKEIAVPDYIAKRKPCKEFKEYEHLFNECQSDLAFGKRKIAPFSNVIRKGLFFILRGVLLYVSKVEKHEYINGRLNARLHCVYENGTESDILLRSLAAELYKDGRLVTEHEDKLLDDFNITEKAENIGYIYVVRSLSERDEIRSIQNLYKIGFSRMPVEERIKNAEAESTFLFAPVAPVISYHCSDLNPQKLESLLHNIFGEVCLNVDLFDKNGKRYLPREWFIAPLEEIEQAIQLLLDQPIYESS